MTTGDKVLAMLDDVLDDASVSMEDKGYDPGTAARTIADLCAALRDLTLAGVMVRAEEGIGKAVSMASMLSALGKSVGPPPPEPPCRVCGAPSILERKFPEAESHYYCALHAADSGE